jgi:hypothetical protein
VSLQPFADAPTMGLLASTATASPAGFPLANGTPTIISWTAPNDGDLHRVTAFSSVVIGTLEVGGAVVLNFTPPGGSAVQYTLSSGGQAAGFDFSGGTRNFTVKPGTVVSIAQTSALTSGAATIWAELWGS